VRRLLPFLGVLAFAVSGLLWLARDSGSERSRPGSTFDTSRSGASLALAYLQGAAASRRPAASPSRSASPR
jgi:hypothetical protein